VNGADPVAALLGQLRAGHPGWTINAHPLGLGLGTAEHRTEDGRSVHYIACYTGGELAARLAVADEEAGP
jgi:hypothetical protein